MGHRLRPFPRLAGRRCVQRPAGRSDRSGSPRGANRLVAGQRGLHYGPLPPRRRGAPRQQAPHVGPGGGRAGAGEGPAKRGGMEEQNGQDERPRIRRRRKLRLKRALLGRSRGGLTSKIHLAADRRCRPLAFVLTAGQAADSPQFIPVLEKVRVRLPVGRPRTRPGAVAGDRAYSSRGKPPLPAETQHQSSHPGKEGPGRKPQERGLTRRPVHQPRRRPLQGTEHRRTPDQQAESLARHRQPLRQVARKLPRRPPPPRLHDLDRRPVQDHHVITTSHRP